MPPAHAGPAVAFDAVPARDRPTGVGVYVRDLGIALVGVDHGGIAFIGVRPGGPLAGVDVPATPFRSGHHVSWLLTQADRDVRSVGARLAHFTNALAPLRSAVPFVLTVQDLSVARYPHYHPPARVMSLPMAAWSARRAATVIVPSTATARELHRFWRVPDRRIVVIPHAPSTSIRPEDTDGALAGPIGERLGTGVDPFVLSVGTLEPRKNHRRLVAAFERVAREVPDLRLVLVGADGWRSRALLRAIDASPVAERIHRPGYLTPAELRAAMDAAAVFVYVSLYEGFGLPVVEAMARGTPVVTSTVSSLPEAAGGAAVLVDPRDAGAIARGIGEALGAAERLRAAGTARANGRGWIDVAGETRDVYRSLLRRL